jgi:hypothetical protein
MAADLTEALKGTALWFGPARWHVLFGARQPLLVPVGSTEIQKACVDHLAGSRVRRWFARAMLRLNTAAPGRNLLPEFFTGVGRRRSGTLLDAAIAGIRVGTSGPYQKTCALLLSERGDALGLAKVGMSETADAMVRREAGWLRRLEEIPALEGRVPRLLEEGVTPDSHRYLVTSVAPGTDVPQAWTREHERFLARLGRVHLRVADFELSGCAGRLQQGLRTLESRLEPDALTGLRTAYRDCEEILLYWTGPYVVAQGDFAPWNTRACGSELFVFDWEYARPGANPLEDVLHFMLATRAVGSRPVHSGYMRAVLARARAFALNAYPEWRWEPRVVAALALAYLLSVVLDYSVASNRLDRGDRIVSSYLRMLRRRSAWMAA